MEKTPTSAGRIVRSGEIAVKGDRLPQGVHDHPAVLAVSHVTFDLRAHLPGGAFIQIVGKTAQQVGTGILSHHQPSSFTVAYSAK
jgi:hypothetical protein